VVTVADSGLINKEKSWMRIQVCLEYFVHLILTALILNHMRFLSRIIIVVTCLLLTGFSNTDKSTQPSPDSGSDRNNKTPETAITDPGKAVYMKYCLACI
jgi:hypothetical protein